MPRQSRIDILGALHHIMVRGIERCKIFRNDKDRDNFIERFEVILSETKTSCYAWALMPNHFHKNFGIQQFESILNEIDLTRNL
jgi:putative transposase